MMAEAKGMLSRMDGFSPFRCRAREVPKVYASRRAVLAGEVGQKQVLTESARRLGVEVGHLSVLDVGYRQEEEASRLHFEELQGNAAELSEIVKTGSDEREYSIPFSG